MSYLKRKAQDTAGGTKKKTKQREPIVRARWPALPVDTFGWKTGIPQDRKIYRALALSQYRLQPSDLKDLAYDNRPRPEGDGYMHLYKECEVEWKAWQVHGGPDGLWLMLRQLRDEHSQSGSDEPFPCPWEYEAGRRFDLDLTSAPNTDRYLMGHITMIAAAAELPTWFWSECNIALNRALSKGELPSGGPESATTERLYAIKAAQQFFHRHSTRYSDRPVAPVRTGKTIWLPTFRALLSNAPTISANLRDTPAWGPVKDKLLFHAGNYQWGDEYLRQVFLQLCKLVADLGLGDDGWRSIRWEVYHKYASSVDGGLRYDARGRFWTDPAGMWLEGQIVPAPAACSGSMRTRGTGAGLQYNALLPVTNPAPRTPSPGLAPVPATQSPVRAPRAVAGPSSA